jgi:hypothetical protein
MSCHRRLNLRIAPRTQPFTSPLLNILSRAHPSPTRKISLTVKFLGHIGDWRFRPKIDAYGLEYGSAAPFDAGSPLDIISRYGRRNRSRRGRRYIQAAGARRMFPCGSTRHLILYVEITSSG